MTKFCKDCKYYDYSNFDNPRCSNANSQQPNMVTGEYYSQYCHDMRSSFGMCKSEAIFFEPKKPKIEVSQVEHKIETPQSTQPQTVGAWLKSIWKELKND